MKRNKPVLLAEKQLVKDEIVHISSRMIKDHNAPEIRGMTEIPMRWITELDKLMHRLDKIDMALAHCNI